MAALLSARPKTIVPPFGPPIVTAPSAKPGIAAGAPSFQPTGTCSAMPEASMSAAAASVAFGVAVAVATGFSPPPPPPSRIARMMISSTSAAPPAMAGISQPGREDSPDFSGFGGLGAFGGGATLLGMIVAGTNSGARVAGSAAGTGSTGGGGVKATGSGTATASTGGGVIALGSLVGGRDGGGAT